MESKTKIVLTAFAIGYFTAVLLVSDSVDLGIAVASGDEVVNLEDGIVIQSSATTVEKHPLVGKIVTSEDGSTCWIVTEEIGVLYYKILESCPGNV